MRRAPPRRSPAPRPAILVSGTQIEPLGGALLRLFGDRASLRDARVVASAIIFGSVDTLRALSTLGPDHTSHLNSEAALAHLAVLLCDLDAPTHSSLTGPWRARGNRDSSCVLVLEQARPSWLAHARKFSDEVRFSPVLEGVFERWAALWRVDLGDWRQPERVSEGEQA